MSRHRKLEVVRPEVEDGAGDRSGSGSNGRTHPQQWLMVGLRSSKRIMRNTWSVLLAFAVLACLAMASDLTGVAVSSCLVVGAMALRLLFHWRVCARIRTRLLHERVRHVRSTSRWDEHIYP